MSNKLLILHNQQLHPWMMLLKKHQQPLLPAQLHLLL
jgi:hypothetical protein